MTTSEKKKVLDKALMKAISQGWTQGEKFIVPDDKEKDRLAEHGFFLTTIVFEPGFGRAFWGEDMIVLRDIKTTRGQTISEEAWRFHQHIILDFLQQAKDDLVYEYLKEFSSQ